MATRFLCREKLEVPHNKGLTILKRCLARRGATLVCVMQDCEEIDNLFGVSQVTTLVIEGEEAALDEVCEWLEYENTGINALVFGEEVSIYCK